MLSYLIHNRIISHATCISSTNRFKLSLKTIDHNCHLSSHCIIDLKWRIICNSCCSVQLVPACNSDVFNKLEVLQIRLHVVHHPHSLLQILSWCQIVVRISHKKEITYSDRTQEYSDFFQDHQLVKGKRSIL